MERTAKALECTSTKVLKQKQDYDEERQPERKAKVLSVEDRTKRIQGAMKAQEGCRENSDFALYAWIKKKNHWIFVLTKQKRGILTSVHSS